MSKVSLLSQIAAVEREIDQRGKVYPRLVAKGQMRQAEADLLVDHMQAVLRTLEWLHANETTIRANVVAAGGRDLS